ncbi:MAG: ROK family protein [Porphyromonadaceae bacterium]|nr:ROK family protein [Porphyromonadaceae bacterium]
MKSYVVGIDMGGTNTAFGIVDSRGNVLAKDSIRTNTHQSINHYIEELYNSLTALIAAQGLTGEIGGIGVGAPNANYFTGVIENAANLPWKGVVPFASLMEKQFGIPVKITNDANAAAIGEMTYGAARGVKDFIMITLGTGVGSGIVANGQLIYGNDGNAGELGHVIVRPNGRLCGCGRKGCLETYTSATGVAHTAREFLELQKADSLLRRIPMQEITSKDVYDAAIVGDKLSVEIFEYTGKILGEAFANFIAFSSPKMIVLFGGLTHAGDLILKPIKKAMEENLLRVFKGKVELVLSQLNEADAAILGASALGWEAAQ